MNKKIWKKGWCLCLTGLMLSQSLETGGLLQVKAAVAMEGESQNSEFEIYNGILKKYAGSAEEITIPEGVKVISETVFENCTTLKSVTFPSSLVTIENRAFKGCTSLNNIKFSNGLEMIEWDAFADCTSLEELQLSDSMKAIDSGAFANCKNLKKVQLPRNVRAIDASAFRGCDKIEEIKIDSANRRFYVDEQGSLYFRDAKYDREMLIRISPNVENYVFPEKVKGTYYNFFDDQINENCDLEYQVNDGEYNEKNYDLGDQTDNDEYNEEDNSTNEKVSLFQKKCNMHQRNFYMTSFCNSKQLKTITLHENVDSINEVTINSCSKLEKIIVDSKNKTFRTDEAGALYKGTKLICVPKNITDYKIEDGTTEISRYAFYNCNNLKSIFLPDGLVEYSIGFVTQIHDLESYKNGSFVLYAPTNSEIERWTNQCKIKYEKIPFVVKNGILERYVGESNVVEIPEDVTEIAEDAFLGDNGITKVIIPDSVTKIGEGAFYGCDNLQEVKLSKNVEKIDESAFAACNKLKTVTIPSGVKIIGKNAFAGCAKLANITLPSTIEKVGNGAFSGCENIKKVNLSKNLKEIGANAFNGCKRLKELTLPASVEKIGDFAMAFTGIEKFTVAKGNKYFSNGTDGCLYNKEKTKLICGINKAKKISIAKTTTKIAADAFRESRITGITLPKGLVTIEGGVFECCNNLKEVKMPDTVKEIGYMAFAACPKLQKVKMSNRVTIIEERAFYQCHKLKDISLSNQLKIIKRYAFGECDSITKVTFPKKLKTIGEHAFSECTSLKQVVIPKSVTEISEGAFYGCHNLETAVIKAKITVLQEAVFAFCKKLKKVELPNTITVFSPYCGMHEMCGAFQYCTNLKNVTIPKKVQKIGWLAFRETGITQITIPEDVTEIEYGVFKNCKNLKKIVIKTKKLKVVEDDVFFEINKNAVIQVPKSKLKAYKKLLQKGNCPKTVKIKGV